ncbi:hypothetical protein AJ79_00374 [Helicocarpus griseus UAMH5409]|uniref:Phosphatidylinositol-specific phospholipase C X domain-containing protein n=1 Tax=Helicocarpus griseus UAMH5409 TaxID=1447875 RepID=A0A2B7YBE9_9EURO|nr:hypothetical protein AJ79_00374 [Helicocarpus griseus UAMH5409]
MAAEYLTVRNLTSTPLILKHVERFPPAQIAKRDIKRFAKSSKKNEKKSTSAADTETLRAEPFDRQDVSICIEPFQSVKSDIRAYDKSDKEQLQLTFDADGEKHEIKTLAPTKESTTLKPLNENPRFKFTGIYIALESHLAIYSSANLNAWMRELKDETYLSALSIPGTHNSPTCYVAAPSVRCQAVNPREQLENGVRFFDVRVQLQFPNDPSKDNLILVHGAFPISFTGHKYFRDVVNEIESFLERNPSEALIMSLKREGPGSHTDAQLSRILRNHYARDGSRWYTEPRVPSLGEVRGKIVLIRRFGLEERLAREWNGRGWGINGEGWANNSPFSTCPSGDICIQDFYEVLKKEKIQQKIDYVNAHFGRTAELCYPFGVIGKEGANGDGDGGVGNRKLPFYINFLSASNFWKMETWPEKIAARVNPAAVDYLCRRHQGEKGDWSTGILVCDWVGLDGDWDLVRCVVGMNTRLMMRQR